MRKEIESERPSSLQEGLNAITQALRVSAELGINTRSLIEKISVESGLSSANDRFTQNMVDKAREIKKAKNK